MRSSRKMWSAMAAGTVVFAMGVLAAPGAAAEPQADPTDATGPSTMSGTAPFVTTKYGVPAIGALEDTGSPEAVPYIAADSAAEAEQMFDAMEARQASGISLQAVNFAPCTLEPRYIHNRTKTGTVGFKPKTTCTQRVTAIHHTSKLTYSYFLTWPTAASRNTGNYNEKSYEQKNLEFACRGTKSTVFRGTTLGKITYNGKAYYSRVYTPKKRLPCKV